MDVTTVAIYSYVYACPGDNFVIIAAYFLHNHTLM